MTRDDVHSMILDLYEEDSCQDCPSLAFLGEKEACGGCSYEKISEKRDIAAQALWDLYETLPRETAETKEDLSSLFIPPCLACDKIDCYNAPCSLCQEPGRPEKSPF